MNSSVGSTLAEQTERVLGIGEPRTPSRNGLAFFALLTAVLVGALVWYALFGAWQAREWYPTAGGALLSLWMACDMAGSYLYARRGMPWGRGLRAFGYVAFFPLSMFSYVAAPWTASPVFLAVQLALIGTGFAWVAAIRRARARARDRGHA
jgi:hypothetical protein